LLSLTQLHRYSDKQKSNQTTRPRETAKRETTRHRKNNYTERTQKEERLSPLGGCPIPGPKNRSGDLLSTYLSLSLASTSQVDRVDLYGLNKMASTLVHPKQTPRLTIFDPSVIETDENRIDYKQAKFRSLSIRTPLSLTRTKRGWNHSYSDRTGPAVRPVKDRTRAYTGPVHLKDRLCN
jgi:hypothetical protein